MGLNTTVVILNDGIEDIKNDKEFGQKLYDAILDLDAENGSISLYSGNRIVGVVVEKHHSSEEVLINVSGNTGEIYDKEFERRLNWSSIAGHVAERKDLINRIKKIAGEYFINGNDDIAKELRKIAEQLKKEGKNNDELLDKFIKGDENNG